MSTLIIPCYLKTDWDLFALTRLLKSVQSQTLPFDHVIIVDDASPLRFKTNYENTEFVTLASNGGPARARNIGINLALSYNEKYIMFTDHDCILDNEWNKNMTIFLQRTDFGAVGGITYSYGKTLYDYYHNINGTLNGKWLLPDKKELWYMPSLNFGMKSAVAKEFCFDERFPNAAGEDVDLCLRLRSKYRIGFCPKAILWHDFGYKSTLTGLKKFIGLFIKYKSSSATLYEGHTILLWDYSESIYPGNAYDFSLQ